MANLTNAKTKLGDFDELTFGNENDMLDYFLQQEKTDSWKEVVTNEINALPLEDINPLMIRVGAVPVMYRGTDMSGKIAEDVTDDDIKDSSQNPKLMVAFPEPNGMIVYPLRYTAFSGIQNRAGIGGRAISRLDNYGPQVEMSAINRAACINMGLELYRNKTKILVRYNNPYDAADGVKVTALMSGDDNDYSILEQYRLINVLRNELSTNFSSYNYLSATTSYEISSISYELDDEAMKNQIANTLIAYGTNVDKSDIKITVRLTTSDVGLCQARLTPIVLINDVPVPIGQIKEVKHQNKATVAKFADECHTFLIKFRDNMKSFEDLGKIKITNPSDCFKRVYEKLNLTGYRDQLLDILERIETEHAFGCSGYDIYWYFCEMLYQKEAAVSAKGDNSYMYKSIKAQETIASILRMDLKEYDY